MLACVCHRSSINYICLQFLQSPEAEATVTHEMDWWTLWDDDNTLPINAVLIDRLQSHYELSTELECAFLIRKDSRQLGRGGGSSTSVTLPFAIQPHPRPLQKTPTNDAPHRSTHVTLSRQNDRSARTPAAHRGSDLTKMQMKSDSLEAIDDPESLKTFDSFMEPSDLYHSTTDNIADGVPSRCSSGQSSASYSTSESDSSSQIPSLFDSPESPESLPSNVSISSAGGAPNNKNKLYQCLVCSKSFPRRSGLETHMNSHTGARPYKCPLPGCDKAFAVRSNAKRHYKTHGFPPSAAESLEPQSTFSVSFDTPRVIYNDEPRGDFPELKWVQPTQTTRMSIDEPDSPSGSDEINSRPVPPSPLSAVYPPGPSSGSWS
ncbi:hypothetical protein PILCRDRAFT_133920 [Piloderma croceum F 1598]|uniref:C2H2-type domain-containing protein n=1 Tax=Piloderma croceum (strain F 1598) TaxID=765440 RepID=A0A0C3GM69_PILCF|nr:hypothetical protein PILCRDRAFT_133920 [Piloderma croceum F 1598]